MRSNRAKVFLKSTTRASMIGLSFALTTPSRAAAAASAPPPAAPAPTPVPPAAEAPAGTVPQAADAPPPEQASPETPASPVSYIEHLGAEAYPDYKRGLYGGSLWLEPSFHGLQWPYMPRSGVGISGYAWVDNGYETIKAGQAAVANTKEYVQQARAVLRTTPTYSDGKFFIQGQLELVGNKDQTETQSDAGSGVVDVDDLWLRVGSWNAWDIKVGRFEAWELYHTGMGLDINTIERRGATVAGIPGSSSFTNPDYYGVTYLHDRPNGQGVGDIALHVYPLPILRFEALAQIGVQNYVSEGDNSLGGRGAGILDLGALKVKVGGEYVKTSPAQQTIVNGMKADNPANMVHYGVGGTVQLVFIPFVELGVSAGYGKASRKDSDGNPVDTAATTTASIGGFVNVSGRLLGPNLAPVLLGLGADYTTQKDNHTDPTTGNVDFIDNLEAFVALQYLVSNRLFVKLVGAYASSYFDLSFGGGQFTNTMLSGRVRLMYLF
jgi:hypothetical protein